MHSIRAWDCQQIWNNGKPGSVTVAHVSILDNSVALFSIDSRMKMPSREGLFQSAEILITEQLYYYA